jgi:membrane protein YqaA with SNARE-associated domain
MHRRPCSVAAYDSLSAFAGGRGGFRLAFWWSFAEATVWPVIPDVALIPLAAAARRRCAVPLAGAVLGTAVGGSLPFLFAFGQPDRARSLLGRLPLARADRMPAVVRWLRRHGPVALLFQPWSGIPAKVWVVAAGGLRLSPRHVIPTLIAARSLRMTAASAGAAALATRFHETVRRRSLVLGLAYILIAGWAVRRVLMAGRG